MDNQETLGLENLGLEEPTLSRKARRTNRGKGKQHKSKVTLLPELQQVSGQHTSSITLCDSSSVPSYQPLPVAPLSGSATTLSTAPSQISHHGMVQKSPGVPRWFIPLPGPPSSSINRSSSIPRVAADPFVQPRLLSTGSEPNVQKSTMSVLTYSLSSSRVDNQCRYSKAKPPLTEATQFGRWTGSPPRKSGKAVSQIARFSQSIKTGISKATPPATRKPSPSIVNGKDDLIHLPAPTPSSTYLSNAHAIPNLLSSPQRLLLVLDLNGALLYRRAPKTYTPRPCLLNFLNYAFANHSLLVWSSAGPDNVKGVCTRLFSPGQRKMLLGEWGRDTLGLTSAQYEQRVQVYKRLDRIWGNENAQQSHPEFEEGERWGQHNTVLIDDSKVKASAHPFNHVEIPEFARGSDEKEGDSRAVLGQVVGYLEEARRWSDVSGFVRHQPFKVDSGWHNKRAQARDQCEDDDEDGGVRL